MRYVMHRWEYDSVRMGHVCVAPTIRGLIGDRCPGCGAFVSDLQLARFANGEPLGTEKTAILNLLGSNPGVAICTS